MDFVKKAVFDSQRFESYCEVLVQSLVKNCTGNGENYFNEHFMTEYMTPASRQANSIVQDYILFLNQDQVSELKVTLQKIVEKWLQKFYSQVTE